VGIQAAEYKEVGHEIRQKNDLERVSKKLALSFNLDFAL
jgi:hypothetical protein